MCTAEVRPQRSAADVRRELDAREEARNNVKLIWRALAAMASGVAPLLQPYIFIGCLCGLETILGPGTDFDVVGHFLEQQRIFYAAHPTTSRCLCHRPAIITRLVEHIAGCPVDAADTSRLLKRT